MTRKTIAALSAAAIIALQFAAIGAAEARSAKCGAVAVPGSPGTFIITCSTSRP